MNTEDSPLFSSSLVVQEELEDRNKNPSYGRGNILHPNSSGLPDQLINVDQGTLYTSIHIYAYQCITYTYMYVFYIMVLARVCVCVCVCVCVHACVCACVRGCVLMCVGVDGCGCGWVWV